MEEFVNSLAVAIKATCRNFHLQFYKPMKQKHHACGSNLEDFQRLVLPKTLLRPGIDLCLRIISPI